MRLVEQLGRTEPAAMDIKAARSDEAREREWHASLATPTMLARARSVAPDQQTTILEQLKAFPLDSLRDDLKLAKLRVLELTLRGMGGLRICG